MDLFPSRDERHCSRPVTRRLQVHACQQRLSCLAWRGVFAGAYVLSSMGKSSKQDAQHDTAPHDTNVHTHA